MTAVKREILRLERQPVTDFNRRDLKALPGQFEPGFVGFSSTPQAHCRPCGTEDAGGGRWRLTRTRTVSYWKALGRSCHLLPSAEDLSFGLQPVVDLMAVLPAAGFVKFIGA